MPLFRYETYTPEIDPSAYIAPTATLIGNITIKSNASVWFNSVLRGDENSIYIGENTNIQDLCIIHVDPFHPAVIGKNVTVGHGAMIHGCTVEDGCLIGIGAKVLDGAVIGKGSVVAAGSVVLENTQVPPNSMVTGTPGKVKKAVSGDMAQIILMMADVYNEKSNKFSDKQKFELVASR